jgi:dihydrofolate synthase/folylpolyglutamate synthase
MGSAVQQAEKPAQQTNHQDIEGRLFAISERLSALYPKLIDLSLERIERFLTQLDNPHLKLPPVIHIAGTNGKGSVTANLRACLETTGAKVHATISPHLVRFNERIVLAGREITDSELLSLLDECDAVNAGAPITYFEVATAATFLAFSRHEADYCLLETGLGGRLDATNIVPQPAACVITAIGYDHMEFLGRTLRDIASEKAGIIKAGVPCVVGPQTYEALKGGVNDVFTSKALSVGAPLYLYGRDWFVEETPLGFRLIHGDKIEDFPKPALYGRHQIDNAATAIMALRAIEKQKGKDIASLADLQKGIQQTRWAGRLQRLTETALNEALPDFSEIYLDGGHNENAAKMLKHELHIWKKREPQKPIHLVLGMLARKDPVSFVRPLADKLDSITCVPVPHETSSLSGEELRALLRKEFPALIIHAAPDTKSALEAIGAQNETPCRALVCGSLYLIGDLLGRYTTSE